MGVGRRLDPLEQDLAELDQRRTVVSLDDGEDVGADVAHDHRRVLGRDLVDRRHLQLDPADPRRAAVGDNLDLALRSLDQMTAVLAQLGVGAAVVLAAEAELPQQLNDAGLVLGRVGGVLEEPVDLGIGVQHRGDLLAVVRVERLGAFEQVLDVEGADPHAAERLRLSLPGVNGLDPASASRNAVASTGNVEDRSQGRVNPPLLLLRCRRPLRPL